MQLNSLNTKLVPASDVLGRAGLKRPGLYTDIGVLGVHPVYLGIASEVRQLTASSWLLHYAKAWWASFFFILNTVYMFYFV